MRRLSVALTGETHRRLAGHLLRVDGQEDVCFGTYRPSTGASRDTYLLGEPILLREGSARYTVTLPSPASTSCAPPRTPNRPGEGSHSPTVTPPAGNGRA